MEERNGKMANTLRPFAHQVGGHYTMMQLDDKTVCKPLNATEQRFYEQVPLELRQFVPRYEGKAPDSSHWSRHGSFGIARNGDERRVISFIGVLDAFLNEEERQVVSHRVVEDVSRVREERQTSEDCVSCCGESHSRMQRVGDYGKFDVAAVRLHGGACDCLRDADASKHQAFDASGKTSSLNSHNCLYEQRFLVLENIVSRFRRPCVLDMKLGWRTYGDDAAQRKIDSQEAKCKATTSSSLGIRICGLQVHDIATDSVRRWDKFYGRKITAETMKTKGLLKFLKPAIALRLSIVSSFILRLTELMHALEKQLTYRFYSSSLLLVYDVDQKEASDDIRQRDWEELMDVRMIDFAHTTWAGAEDNGVVKHSGPDQGYLFGLQNMIRLLQEIERDYYIGDAAQK